MGSKTRNQNQNHHPNQNHKDKSEEGRENGAAYPFHHHVRSLGGPNSPESDVFSTPGHHRRGATLDVFSSVFDSSPMSPTAEDMMMGGKGKGREYPYLSLYDPLPISANSRPPDDEGDSWVDTDTSVDGMSEVDVDVDMDPAVHVDSDEQ